KQDVIKGTSGTAYPLIIENNGVEDRSYELSVDNIESWATYRFDPEEKVSVEAGEAEIIYLYIIPIEDAQPGEKVFMVTVETDEDEKKIALTANVIEEEPAYDNDFNFSFFIIFILIFISVLIIYLLLFILWIFMIYDCIKRDFSSKLVWLLILTLVPLGQIFYYFIVKRRKGKQKVVNKFETLSLLSLLLGIVSTSIPIYFGFLTGVPSIILGIVAKNKLKKSDKSNNVISKAGIILGIIGVVLQILFFAVYFMFIFFIMSLSAMQN
ncbi:DUF4190 domain-containing protein, partial [Candidatus Woesearchaeota archaeon]|nr:DUF4190 domain-containing protein [Candidatus Woesearchaeota archaeon]